MLKIFFKCCLFAFILAEKPYVLNLKLCAYPEIG